MMIFAAVAYDEPQPRETVKIRSAAHLYAPMGKPMAWIFTIARNICLAKYRMIKHFTGVSVDEVKEPITVG